MNCQHCGEPGATSYFAGNPRAYCADEAACIRRRFIAIELRKIVEETDRQIMALSTEKEEEK